jgi:hypothetical protein
MVRVVHVVPSGDVAHVLVELPTPPCAIQNTVPFQAASALDTATGNVRVVQVIPSGDVAHSDVALDGFEATRLPPAPATKTVPFQQRALIRILLPAIGVIAVQVVPSAE